MSKYPRISTNKNIWIIYFYLWHLVIINLYELQILIVFSLLSLDFLPETFEDVDILFFLLNHLHPTFSHLQDSFLTIQSSDSAVTVILDKFEDSDECSSPSNPRTAVNQDGIFLGGVEFHSFVHEISDNIGVVRGSEVAPLYGLKLRHFNRRLVGPLNSDHSEEEEKCL